jgi:hypothetical protein
MGAIATGLTALRDYDFTLLPNASVELAVTGDYIKFIGGNGSIIVKLDTGGSVPLQNGQGLKNRTYSKLRIIDAGQGSSGKLFLGFGSEFIDDRISGVVEVVDGERVRSSAGLAFGSFAFVPSDGITPFGGVQLWNQATNRNVVLQSVSYQTTGVSGVFAFVLNATQLTTNVSAASAQAKRAPLFGTLGAGQIFVGLSATGAPAAKLFSSLCSVNVTQFWVPKGGVVIGPNQGFTVFNQTANQGCVAGFEWYEEPI